MTNIMKIAPMMSPEVLKQVLVTFGVPEKFEHFSAGDREVYGSHNPLTGAFSPREAQYGMDPTKKMESENTLRGTYRTADSRENAAGINARGRVNAANINAEGRVRAAAERPPKKSPLRTIQTEKGIMLLDPVTGEMTPTGYQAPPKGGAAGGEVSLENVIAELQQPGQEGFWSNLWRGVTGGTPAAAQPAPAMPVAPTPIQGPRHNDPLNLIDPKRLEEARAGGYSDDEIRAWILQNGDHQ